MEDFKEAFAEIKDIKTYDLIARVMCEQMDGASTRELIRGLERYSQN